MRNPLMKRLPRELKSDFGKYIVIFLFMIITVGFISGFVVSTHSLAYAFDNSFDSQNVEDGHFILEDKMTGDLPDKIESTDTACYDINYKDIEKGDKTYRVYKNREDVNKQYIFKGELAKTADEITLDRLFAANNSIEIGDSITLAGEIFKVTGTVALPDYTSLFEKSTGLMFNAQTFTVALVTEEGFDRLPDSHTTYCYAWTFNDESLSENEKFDKSNDLKEEIAKNALMTEFITEPNNQAIHFAGDDIGSDESMMITFLYIIIVIMAFIFAVTTSNTIEKESKVIGTLRASGYTKGELTFHYIVIPVFVTLFGALIGNILGYTVFKDFVADVYYGSYSLPPYETLWSSFAFVNTTVVPCVIMLVVNFFIISSKLSLSPLKFLRSDLKKSKNRKAVKLPNFKFIHRFRIRIFMQNFPTYIVMFVGVFFANFLLLFGLMMNPWLENYKAQAVEHAFSDYQYILKMPVETEVEGAEKFTTTSLETTFEKSPVNEISVYGIEDNSLYLSTLDFGKDGDRIYVSEGILKKYKLSEGDTITLKKKFTDDTYDFKIYKGFDYPTAMAVFMNIDNYRETFDLDDDYFTGYLSNTEIDDIDDDFILTTVTIADSTVLADQLTASMSGIFGIWTVFAVVLSTLVFYLLSKIIIEKNSNSVSLVKILGFKNGEISSLYLIVTGVVVVLSAIICLPICDAVFQSVFTVMMSSFNAWIDLYIAPKVWIEIPVYAIVSYFIVALLQFRKIKKIPMDEALKNAE